MDKSCLRLFVPPLSLANIRAPQNRFLSISGWTAAFLSPSSELPVPWTRAGEEGGQPPAPPRGHVPTAHCAPTQPRPTAVGHVSPFPPHANCSCPVPITAVAPRSPRHPPALQIPAAAVFLLPCSHLAMSPPPPLLRLKVLLLNPATRAGVQPAPRTRQSRELPRTSTHPLLPLSFYLPLPSTARPRLLIHSPYAVCCAAVSCNSHRVARLVSFSSVKHCVPTKGTPKSSCVAFHRVLKACTGDVYVAGWESPELSSSRT